MIMIGSLLLAFALSIVAPKFTKTSGPPGAHGGSLLPRSYLPDCIKAFSYLPVVLYTLSRVDSVSPKVWNWWVVYAATALLCFVIALTTGPSNVSHAWHTGAVIVIAGIVYLWRVSVR